MRKRTDGEIAAEALRRVRRDKREYRVLIRLARAIASAAACDDAGMLIGR